MTTQHNPECGLDCVSAGAVRKRTDERKGYTSGNVSNEEAIMMGAARDMYEALCAVMSDTDDLDLDLLADLTPDTVRLINAALAKAEGRDR